MGFVAIAAILVAFSVSFASCQLDCAQPHKDDVARVISNALPAGDNPTPAIIEVFELKLLCLAASEQRGRYRFFSALVKYRCTSQSSGCPVGNATEQFESQCDNNGVFSHIVDGQTDNTRRSDPIATFDTATRTDCAFCISDALIAANPSSTLTTDDTTHCVGCTGCSETVGQNSCFGFGVQRCCNVYVNDMCDTDCPTTGLFTSSPYTFECLATCPDLGNNVENGNVVYSKSATATGGRYSRGTTATVSCSRGYSGGGVITCQDTGDWSSPDLPSCEIHYSAERCGYEKNKTQVTRVELERYGNCVPYDTSTIPSGTPCNDLFQQRLDYVYIPYTRTGGDLTSYLGFLIDVNIVFQLAPDQCKREVQLILCHYFLPPCGNSTVLKPPTSVCKDVCNYLRDLCPVEYEFMLDYFQQRPSLLLAGLTFINCSNTGEYIEPLPQCCSDVGIDIPCTVLDESGELVSDPGCMSSAILPTPTPTKDPDSSSDGLIAGVATAVGAMVMVIIWLLLC